MYGFGFEDEDEEPLTVESVGKKLEVLEQLETLHLPSFKDTVIGILSLLSGCPPDCGKTHESLKGELILEILERVSDLMEISCEIMGVVKGVAAEPPLPVNNDDHHLTSCKKFRSHASLPAQDLKTDVK
ncbi:hypothetical protein PtB15_6B96 [Puccinia triticina]|nr:hypothetical protein PtB15_6B96 [Puccinia triticina]